MTAPDSGRLNAWIAPAVVIGMCSVAFSVGVFVGEQRNAAVIAAVDQRLTSHQARDLHAGAVPSNVYTARDESTRRRLDEMADRLQRIEDKLQQLVNERVTR